MGIMADKTSRASITHQYSERLERPSNSKKRLTANCMASGKVRVFYKKTDKKSKK